MMSRRIYSISHPLYGGKMSKWTEVREKQSARRPSSIHWSRITWFLWRVFFFFFRQTFILGNVTLFKMDLQNLHIWVIIMERNDIFESTLGDEKKKLELLPLLFFRNTFNAQSRVALKPCVFSTSRIEFCILGSVFFFYFSCSSFLHFNITNQRRLNWPHFRSFVNTWLLRSARLALGFLAAKKTTTLRCLFRTLTSQRPHCFSQGGERCKGKDSTLSFFCAAFWQDWRFYCLGVKKKKKKMVKWTSA